VTGTVYLENDSPTDGGKGINESGRGEESQSPLIL